MGNLFNKAYRKIGAINFNALKNSNIKPFKKEK
jgi:hypothetical protein